MSGLATLARGGHRQLLVEIGHDDQTGEVARTPSIFVGNNPLQLEQVGLAEADDVVRQRLAAVIVRPVGAAKLLWLALRGMLGQLGEDRNVRNFSFRSMTVQPLGRSAGRHIKVAVDGEILRMQPPLRFCVAAHPLMLIVPSAAADAEK